MGTMASLITSLTGVYSTVHPGADQTKHQSSASLAFVWVIHRRPVNSPHKWPVTRKMLPFDDVIMIIFWFKLHWNLLQPKKHLAITWNGGIYCWCIYTWYGLNEYKHIVVPLIFDSIRQNNAYFVNKLTIIGSDNALSPNRRQASI